MSVVERIDPLGDASWDSKLEAFADASFFHGTAWARVLHATYGYAPVYLSVGKEADSALMLPAMEVSSWLTGRRGISLPFTDECVALGSHPESYRLMFRQLITLAGIRRWRYCELRGGNSMAGDVPASVSFHGHAVKLEPDPVSLFSRFNGAVRTAVRKAEQAGLTVEFAQSMPAVRTFYDLLCQTRSRHGMPPQPFPFFENIQRHVLQGNKGFVVLARLGRIPVAGAVFFHLARNAIYKFAASNEAYKHLQGNNLVLWRAMERYARSGFSSIDFGRTSLNNSGLRRFKLAWHAEERRIDYRRYDRLKNTFVRSSDQSSGRWHTTLFKSLPLGVSRLIGSVAYKHLA